MPAEPAWHKSLKRVMSMDPPVDDDGVSVRVKGAWESYSATKSAKQELATLAESEAAALKAKDGNAAFGLGLAVSGSGAHERGLALMTQGLAKGGLRRPDDAMLHLGLVQWRAGKIDDAKRSFAAVKGSDGAADLARLWSVYLASPARK